MKTREQALEGLARVIAEAWEATRYLTPMEAAQRAWHPGGPSVEYLAVTIAATRAGEPQ